MAQVRAARTRRQHRPTRVGEDRNQQSEAATSSSELMDGVAVYHWGHRTNAIVGRLPYRLVIQLVSKMSPTLIQGDRVTVDQSRSSNDWLKEIRAAVEQHGTLPK